MAQNPQPERTARTVSLRPALVGVALLTIAVGVGIYLAIDETIGAVIAAFGVLDLLTIPFVARMISRGAASSAGASGDGPEATAPTASAEADPSYNPYARED